MRFCLGVTLYNPKAEELERISGYLPYFDKVIVYDNSLSGRARGEWLADERMEYVFAGRNDGISAAVNYMIRRCSEEGLECLCTLDQDSVFEARSIRIMKRVIERKEYSDTAIFAPRVIEGRGTPLLREPGTRETRWAITSGSFLNIRLINRYHLRYDEKLFIDRCDRDFCEQARRAGLRIVVVEAAVLTQRLGERNRFGYPEHGVLRHYYIFRNRFYYNRKYYHGAERFFLNLAQTGKQIWLIVFCEGNKTRKLRQLGRAFRDYREGNMGRRG